MRKIQLTRGYIAMVDNKDFKSLSQYSWFAWTPRNYAARNIKVNGKQKPLFMHRVIMGVTNNKKVDHKDGNVLNNCRKNLRICTQGQNAQNRSPNIGKQYKGIYRVAEEKWRAYIRYNYKRIHIGYFHTDKEAATAYNKTAKKLFGKFAKLNIIL